MANGWSPMRWLMVLAAILAFLGMCFSIILGGNTLPVSLSGLQQQLYHPPHAGLPHLKSNVGLGSSRSTDTKGPAAGRSERVHEGRSMRLSSATLSPGLPPAPSGPRGFDPYAAPITSRGPDGGLNSSSGAASPATSSTRRQSTVLPPLEVQLKELEDSLPRKTVANYDFQKTVKRDSGTTRRPHHDEFDEEVLFKWLRNGLQPSCPSTIRPDEFCAPNVGRDWRKHHRVYPISYSLPEEMFFGSGDATMDITMDKLRKAKDKDCAVIVPRDKNTYKFSTQDAYIYEYTRSYYCITFKKGGWDALRHYEIIAAGCMPYIVDIDYSPVGVMVHLPKKLLLEARDLPGVEFHCKNISVAIDHSIFDKERYFTLLRQLQEHARQHITTVSMAKYVLRVSGNEQAKKVLYLVGNPNKKSVPLRAKGNYNTWTLFHGLRTLLGIRGAIDNWAIPFLYYQGKEYREKNNRMMYGMGFGYAYFLRNQSAVDRENLEARIRAKEFDVIVWADPPGLLVRGKRFLYYDAAIAAGYDKRQLMFIHASDIPYADPKWFGYSPHDLYDLGTVLQREIADCSYYAPPGRRSEMMKRCVWYHNKNCLDDVNTQMAINNKRLKQYVWSFPVLK